MKKFILTILLTFLPLTFTAQNNYENKWTATYYGTTYKGIRHTANGEIFNMYAMTCAAPKYIKFGTLLKVTNLDNKTSVTVRVNDRGAFGNRNVDLTYGAFKRIANPKLGRIKVKVETVKEQS